MLSFFKSKKHFVDIWSGTPDIHSHVLPNIDDGAQNVEESIMMLNKYKELRCTEILATPHIMEGVYDNNLKTITNAQQEIINNNSSLVPSIGAEHMLDSLFEKSLQKDDIISFGDQYVLIEMSYFQPPENLKNIIFTLLSKGYKPILAHPERYTYYHRDINILLELKELGCKFQLNALSISGHYGSHTKEIAFNLIKNNHYDYIGTDAHKLDHLVKLSTILIARKYEYQLKKVCDNTVDLMS